MSASASPPTYATLKLRRASPPDAAAWATCFLDAFSHGPAPQVPFYSAMFPREPGTHNFFATTFETQMKSEPDCHFMCVVDEAEGGRVVGFAKWTPPGTPESFWADYAPAMNADVCNQFFGAMAEHREKLMGGRPHWYLEIMGVALSHQRRGVGKMLLQYGADVIDETGTEAYVDASPAGMGLYAKYGFESRAHVFFKEPFEWYREDYMVRPAKNQKQ